MTCTTYHSTTKEGLHHPQGYFFHHEASFGVNKHMKEIPPSGLADGVDLEAHLGWFQGHEEASDGSFCHLVLHHRLIQGDLLLWVVVLEAGRGDGVPDVLDWVQGVILLEEVVLLLALDFVESFGGIGADQELGEEIESSPGHR